MVVNDAAADLQKLFESSYRVIFKNKQLFGISIDMLFKTIHFIKILKKVFQV